MKKTLLLLIFIFGFYQTNHAQAVGILGPALSGYTANDINLTQISQYEFILLNLIIAAKVCVGLICIVESFIEEEDDGF